jgi:hypothetical protein
MQETSMTRNRGRKYDEHGQNCAARTFDIRTIQQGAKKEIRENERGGTHQAWGR